MGNDYMVYMYSGILIIYKEKWIGKIYRIKNRIVKYYVKWILVIYYICVFIYGRLSIG